MVPRFAYPALIFLQFVAARVTFPDSEVLQAPDLLATNRANFKCTNGCSVYADKRYDLIKIMENGTVITDFSKLYRNEEAYGIELDPSDGYYIENQGEVNPSFVLYAVDRTAPKNNTEVYVPITEALTQIFQTDRYLTILSSFPAIIVSFTGTYREGYPRIYSTGFDVVNSGRCSPVYHAKSEQHALNSSLLIPSAVLTVDFGEEGDNHSVSVVPNDGKNVPKLGATSLVYPSPGFVGCSFFGEDVIPMNQYFSTLRGIQDSFTVNCSSLEMSAWMSNIPEGMNITLNINNDEKGSKEEIGFLGSFPTSHMLSYPGGTYRIDFEWLRESEYTSFVLQFDFGLDYYPRIYTEEPSTSTIMSTTTSSAPGRLITLSLIASIIVHIL